MTTAQETEFDRATRVSVEDRSPDGGRYQACLDPGWSGGAGPHGGYLAAIAARALTEQVADPARPLRAISCQYPTGLAPGEATVVVRVRRHGRSVSFVDAQIEQDGRVGVLATSVFAVSGQTPVSYEPAVMPAYRPFESSPPLTVPGLPSLFDRLDLREAQDERVGQPRRAGWVSFVDPRPVDPAALCLIADCWLPTPFAGTTAVPQTPTLTYSVLFRERPHASAEPVLLDLSSAAAVDGLFEEDGRVWSRDGRLLAQSRQLALLR